MLVLTSPSQLNAASKEVFDLVHCQNLQLRLSQLERSSLEVPIELSQVSEHGMQQSHRTALTDLNHDDPVYRSVAKLCMALLFFMMGSEDPRLLFAFICQPCQRRQLRVK